VTPIVASGREHVYHQYTVRITDEARLDRDALSAALASREIESAVFYPRIVYDYEVLRTHPGVAAAHVPEAQRACREVLSLPVHPGLTSGDVDRIIEEVRAPLCDTGAHVR
jgi:dTDP-4-amino-4,6-dideoxygalactose transaminase